MNLRSFDQSIDIYFSEARVLKSVLEAYHHRLTVGSVTRPLTLAQSMTIRPTTQVLQRVSRLLTTGNWCYNVRAMMRPRKFRLEFDEQLQLNALWIAGELDIPFPDPRRMELINVLGRVNQKAQNLTSYFQL